MILLRLFLLVVLASASSLAHAQRERLPPEDLEIVERRWPEAKRTAMGLRWIVQKEGAGPLVKKGDLVSVIYTGRLLNDQVFDENLDRAKPFNFRVGRGMVIDGWEQALQLMRPGERRLLIVPHELAYGTRGQPPKIPRRATLVFEVEIVAVNPPETTP